MNRLFLLLFLLALILLGGLRDSTLIRAQEITATGSLSEASAVEMGESLQSSHIELTFPGEGGEVTGEWTVVVEIDLGPTDEDGGVCIYTLTATGPLDGSYDGGSALIGTTMATFSPTIVSGCQNVNLSPFGETNDWSGTFVERQVAVAVDSSEFPLEFVATSPPVGAAPPPEPDADADADGGDSDAGAPPDAADDGEPASGEDSAFVDVFFGTAGLTALHPRAREVIFCPTQARRMRDCIGAQRTVETTVAFNESFKKDFPDPSPSDNEYANQLNQAISLATLVGRDLKPLFPSVATAMPLIRGLVDRRALTPSGVQRFVDLLAARDAAQWDERFP